VGAVRRVADGVGAVLERAPHLPEGVRRGLAAWLWLIAAVLGLVELGGGIADLRTASAVGGVCGVAGGFLGSCAQVEAALGVAGIAAIASAVVVGLAVVPARALEAHGWERLFLATIVAIVGGLVSDVLVDPLGVIGTAIWALVALWVLFEAREAYHS
jgi:hypothetical protein